MNGVSLLERPIYGVSQVDRLLNLHPGTSKRWIDGYIRAGRTYDPIVRPETTGSEIVTWGEFVETSLLAKYREYGVAVQKLCPVVEKLRQELRTPFPLASRKLYVHERELVAEIQDANNLDSKLCFVVVRTGQYLLSPRAEMFYNATQWDEVSGEASEIQPNSGTPLVRINPLHAFGEPAVRSVKTSTIAEEFRTGESVAGIASDYELTIEQVEDALRFEIPSAA